ncbi:MAG: hypothetical protein ACFFCS_24585 [Candidatus Hodarchaeota archaeon]
MVKLKIALDSLSKAQILEIVNACPGITVSKSATKHKIIEQLSVELPREKRMQCLSESFDSKDETIFKLFMNKKYKYNGMNQMDFTKFLTYNKRMKYDFIPNINKLRSQGVVFTGVMIKNKSMVVIPSDYFKFLTQFINGGNGEKE